MKKARIQAVTTAIILETRKPGKNGLFPVKLRVTYKRNRRYYTMRHESGKSIWLTETDFPRVIKENPKESYKNLSLHLHELEHLAHKVIEKLHVFSFAEFEKNYFEKRGNDQDLIQGLTSYEEDLLKSGRISSGKSFSCTLASIKKFTGKSVLPFEEISVQFLLNFEKWMLENGNGLTTVGIYLRNVRTIYRKAIKSGVVSDVIYPFGSARDGKYEIPTGRNVKRALKHSDVGLIANCKVIPGTPEQKYKDYWLFCYLCNGINVKDMARLTYANIKGNVIVITRAKTEREKRHNPKPITIVVVKLIKQIIERWGVKPALPDQFIFPILTREMTPLLEYKAIQQETKMINTYIGRIAGSLGITEKVTTLTARHSFATVLKRSGASTEFIGESLGHASLPTTENYLADFEIEEKTKWAENLTNF